jgi:hypothetical protein
VYSRGGKKTHPVRHAGELPVRLTYTFFHGFSDLNTAGQGTRMCDTGGLKISQFAVFFI